MNKLWFLFIGILVIVVVVTIVVYFQQQNNTGGEASQTVTIPKPDWYPTRKSSLGRQELIK